MAENNELDPFKQAFLNAFPNPDRIGCPDQQTLKALARRKLPLNHPAQIHISQCSPCFREVLAYQAQWQRGRRHTRIGLVAAALLLLTIGAFWAYRSLSLGSPVRWMARGNWPAPPSNPVQVPGVLNYQGISAKRGTDSPSATPTNEQIIFRSVRELAIVLPMGREAGSYVVEIFPKTDRSKPLARYTGHASIDSDGVTTLRTPVDFTAFPAGTYTVSWQMVGSDFSQSGAFVLR
jgi:hypothetical protein